MHQLFENFHKFLIGEGGNLAPELTADVKLTPQVVERANKVFIKVLGDWNRWLEERGHAPVKPIKPVGSTGHYEKDLSSSPEELHRAYGSEDVEYGDIDYLVEFPFPEDFTGDDTLRRKEENKIKREYGQLMTEFFEILQGSPEVVKISQPMLVVRLPDGDHVQIDAIITFPKYSRWMGTRYIPERGIKGYITGNLYSSFANALIMTIGSEGVLVRTQYGERVTGRVRKDVVYNTISTDPDNFLMDIANYIIKSDFTPHPLLGQYPGWSKDEVRISDIAKGMKGFALTLEDNTEDFSAVEFLSEISDVLKERLEKFVEHKRYILAKKNHPHADEKVNKMIKQNNKVHAIVQGVFKGEKK